MKVNRFVVHELLKDAKKSNSEDAEVQLVLSEHLANVDEKANTLIEEIHKSFSQNPSLKHSRFEDRNDKVFKKSFEKYNTSQTNDLFLSFSKDSLKELKTLISKEPFATGGYYVFCDYVIDNKQFVTVVLLRKRSGINVAFVNNAYEVLTNENLNIDKIAMGFRLNYEVYIDRTNDKNYIALITNQQDKLSGYFKDWVVAAGIISDEKNTSSLVKILNLIPLPADHTGKEKYNRDDFKRASYDLIEQHPEKRVNLLHLGEYFFGEEGQTNFMKYADANSITIDTEFKRNPSKLRKLITIKAKVEGIELIVNYGKLNENNVDVHEKENYIIIRSKELVEQIVKQQNESV